MRIEQHIVSAWASQLTSKIISDAINALQKMDSEEMLSGDSGLKNVWEEICVQVQGEHSCFWETYLETMESLLADGVALINQDARLAIWAVTEAGWNYFYDHYADDEGTADIPVNEEEIVALLMDKLVSEADDHESPSITRFLNGADELEEEDDENESDYSEADSTGGEIAAQSKISTLSRARNALQLSLAEFKRATKVFTPKRLKLGPALLGFESGFLSIESGEVTAVMRATGEWHGRATISPQTLRAIATVPPSQDPFTISYADGHLLIASMTIACEWHPVSERLIHDLENPSLFDLVVMERTLPRAEIKSTELGQRVTAAAKDAEKRIRKAASQLADMHVTEAEILALVDSKIKVRLKRG